MKFAYTILYVNKVPETVEFYKSAFGFSVKLITPEKDYAELSTGETTIAFAATELGNSNFKSGVQTSSIAQKPFGIELAFTSENIELDFNKAITAGAVVYEKLVQKPWGQIVGYVRDNNGFLIEICTPIPPSK